MRILLLFLLIVLLSSCTSVKVAKEVTKASKSIKTTVNNIINSSENADEDKGIIDTVNEKNAINHEKQILEKEKQEKQEIIKEQKKEAKIDFLNKNSEEIKLMIGNPKLIRIDGNSLTERFDNNFCQLFLFSNIKTKNSKIEYFEIRNKEGKLIINKKKIEKCYKNFKLI